MAHVGSWMGAIIGAQLRGKHNVGCAAVQDNAKGLLLYHWNTPNSANTEWIMERKHQRSPYDRPYAAIAGTIGRQVRTSHCSFSCSAAWHAPMKRHAGLPSRKGRRIRLTP